jgi:hypothetical protein
MLGRIRDRGKRSEHFKSGTCDSGHRRFVNPPSIQIRQRIDNGDVRQCRRRRGRADQARHGEYLPLVGDFMSFNEIIDTLNRQGHNFSFNQVPKEVFGGLFAGAAEIAEMFNYFRFRFARPSCARKQNRRPAADKVLGVGSSEFPGSKERRLGSTVIEKRKETDFSQRRQPWFARLLLSNGTCNENTHYDFSFPLHRDDGRLLIPELESDV